jgi:hypothetical protein
MRNNLFLLGVFALATALMGCEGNGSDILPADGREVQAPANATPDAYNGRAVDGYLRDAFVWLDINDDNVWDEATEPSAYTVAGGYFTLDLSAINDARRAANQKALEPRDYPLVLLALPGKTVDEGAETGNGIVSRAYFMLAPPGSTLISPLTTLVRINAGTSYIYSRPPNDSKTVAEAVSDTHNATRKNLKRALNFLQDYVNADNAREVKYSAGVVQLLQNHTTDQMNSDFLAGNLFVYSDDSVAIISRTVFSLTEGVWNQMDALAASTGSYETIDLSLVNYETIDIDEQDPYVLVTESSFKNVDLSADNNLKTGARTLSSEIKYAYMTNGDVAGFSVDGYRENAPAYIPWFESDIRLIVETEQQWLKNGVIDQQVTYQRVGKDIVGYSVDSIHALDHDPSLSKPVAQDITLNSNPYTLDAVPEHVVSITRENGLYKSLSVVSPTESSEIVYTYDDNNRLLKVEEFRPNAQNGALTREWNFSYDLEKVVNAGRDNEQTILIAMKVLEMNMAGDAPALARSYEFVTKQIDIAGTDVEVLDYVFIDDQVRPFKDRYLKWELSYISAIDLARGEGHNVVGLDEANAEDLAKARSMINDKRLLQLEGRLEEKNFKPSDRNGLSTAAFTVYIRNAYAYDKLSNVIF